MKKTVCALLCAILCFSFASCKKNPGGTSSDIAPEASEKIKYEEINLLYYSGDSFNPYTAKTKHNRQLARLLYDSLLKYDNNYNPVYCLAQSASISGKTCRVTLKSANFTDGSAVTPDDVVYSYNLAKNSNTIYAAELYEVASVSVEGNAVIFNLSNVDLSFLNLLDFPIIKAGTDGKKNSDGVEIAPVGCGRYYVSENPNILLRNENYFGKKGEISKITLINAPDDISASHYVEVGNTDIYYADESVANIARMSGKRADVNLNNFVYIGVNGADAVLSNSNMRYAISSAIDRTEICHSAYFDNAVPATGYYNPKFNVTNAVQSLKTVADLQITVENLSKIGYNNLDKGYYCDSNGKHPTFSLLVNSDNTSRVAAANLIANGCRAAGIEINVVSKPYEQYKKALEAGAFQLYLGEIRVLPNMDLSSLVIPGGSAAYGVVAPVSDDEAKTPLKTVCGEMIESYREGKVKHSDLAGTFLTEMPQIPVCYRQGILFYTSAIESGVAPSASDVFLNLENYKIK